MKALVQPVRTARARPERLGIALVGALLGAFVGALAATMSGGCSLLGTAGGTPEGLPHGGTGPFRDLTRAETRLAREGTAVLPGDVAVERSMVGGLRLFYVAAAPRALPDAGMPDAGPLDASVIDAGDLDAGVTDAGPPPDAAVTDAGPPPDAGMDAGPPPPPADIDWSLYVPRRIFSSAPNAETWGYPAGAVVLEATQAWEGGYVADPWGLELEDGRARLYYAAEGGIGVAEASSIDGTFTTVSTTAPAIGVMGGATPRCPTVVSTAGLAAEGAFLMFYELDGTIRRARSDDGVTFTDLGEITVLRTESDGAVLPTLPPRDSRDGNEISRGCPGAMIAHTPSDRSVLRLYYESRRDNGAALLGMFASSDGASFEAHPLPVFLERDRRMPAPREVDARITVLFHWAPRLVRVEQRGDIHIGVAPGGATLSGGTR